jgi:hypothetical protein
MSVAELHRELCTAVYGPNVMSEGTVRQSCRTFKDGEQMFTMKREVAGEPPAVSVHLVQSVDQKICEKQRFAFSEFSCKFSQITHPVLYEIVIRETKYSEKTCPSATLSTTDPLQPDPSSNPGRRCGSQRLTA